MITDKDLEKFQDKVPTFDFVEQEGGTDGVTPVQRPIARVIETIQIFKPMEMYEERAQLALDIKKAKQDLKQDVLNLKFKNLEDALRDALKNMQIQHDLYDKELKDIDKALDLENMEKEWNIAKQKQLAEEKAKEEANIKKAK